MELQLHSFICFFCFLPLIQAAPVLEGGPFPLQLNTESTNNEDIVEYGVVVDAGSSGSRARVYSWPKQTQPNLVPDIEEIYSYKQEPGIADFADDLPGLDPYIRHLVSMAANNVPSDAHAQTRIYFMATAGMRLLLEEKANAIMDRINSLLMNVEINPFSYEPLNSRILSGEEEGAFAWITVNHLTGYFNNRQESPDALSSGIMEMGGASLQIAFEPEGSILADKFPVKVAAQIYPLYVHSYLYYGQDYADLWVKQYLYDERPEKDNIQNPCMLKDDSISQEIRGENVTYIGVGDPDACREILDIYLYEVDPRRCQPKPCAIGPVYQPSIDVMQDFFALGAFIYPLRLLDVLQPDGSFSLTETNTSAYEYCVKDIWTVQNETGRTDPYLSVECLTGLYIPTLLVKAFKFQADSTQLKAVTKINEQPTEWTLGALIYENERREWQCPSQSGATSRHNGATPSNLAILVGMVFCILYTSPACPDALHNITTNNSREEIVQAVREIK